MEALKLGLCMNASKRDISNIELKLKNYTPISEFKELQERARAEPFTQKSPEEKQDQDQKSAT